MNGWSRTPEFACPPTDDLRECVRVDAVPIRSVATGGLKRGLGGSLIDHQGFIEIEEYCRDRHCPLHNELPLRCLQTLRLKTSAKPPARHARTGVGTHAPPQSQEGQHWCHAVRQIERCTDDMTGSSCWVQEARPATRRSMSARLFSSVTATNMQSASTGKSRPRS